MLLLWLWKAASTYSWPHATTAEDVTKGTEADLPDDATQVGSSLDETTLEGDLLHGPAPLVEEQDVENRDDQIDGEPVVVDVGGQERGWTSTFVSQNCHLPTTQTRVLYTYKS